LAGSYYVEALDGEPGRRARKLIGEVEALGGMTKAVEAGMPKIAHRRSLGAGQAASIAARKLIVA